MTLTPAADRARRPERRERDDAHAAAARRVGHVLRLERAVTLAAGIGRIVALHYLSSALHQIH